MLLADTGIRILWIKIMVCPNKTLTTENVGNIIAKRAWYRALRILGDER